jgi:hypothetical protein
LMIGVACFVRLGRMSTRLTKPTVDFLRERDFPRARERTGA